MNGKQRISTSVRFYQEITYCVMPRPPPCKVIGNFKGEGLSNVSLNIKKEKLIKSGISRVVGMGGVWIFSWATHFAKMPIQCYTVAKPNPIFVLTHTDIIFCSTFATSR